MQTLVAAALLAEDDNPMQPCRITLMAGQIDARVNPTKVNQLANSQPIEWFERNLIAPLGELRWRGRRVDLGAIRRTALLTVEGKKDDICSIGQTVAAHELCTSVPPYMRRHHMQAGVATTGCSRERAGIRRSIRCYVISYAQAIERSARRPVHKAATLRERALFKMDREDVAVNVD